MVASTGLLNVNQVYQLLLNNGASQSEAANLAGISVWEAGGGNPNAINPQALNNNANTQDYSVGLFQYNFRAGNFVPTNPMASTRGGYTPPQLLGDLNAQAQSALALLRGSSSGYLNWTTYTSDYNSIKGYVAQLLGSGTANPSSDNGITSTPSDTGGGVTDIPANPTVGVQGQTGTNATTGVQGQTQAIATTPGSGAPLNLNFAGSLQHIGFQFLLVLIAIAILLGGIYLLGSGHR